MTNSSWLYRWNAIACLAISLGALPAVASHPNSVTQKVVPTSLIAINRPVLKLGSQGIEVSELQAALKLLGYFAGDVDGFYGESTANAVSRFQQASGLNIDGVTGAATWERLFPRVPFVENSSTPRIANNRQISTNSVSGFPVPSSLQRTNVRDSRVNVRTTSLQRTNVRDSRVNVGTTFEQVNRPQYRNPSITSTAANSQTVAVSLPLLKLGMRGSAIAHLQSRLRSLGFFSGSIDGVFGEATQAAVKAAQDQFNIEPDGVVGASTWSALLR